MPIILKDFTWTETLNEIFLNVRLKCVNAKHVDLYSNDSYIKINCPPYLFELDLLHRIDDSASSASIGNGCISFRLVKIEPKTWGELSASLNREQILKQRSEASERKRMKETMQSSSESVWVRHQIQAEERARRMISDRKDQELKEAITELNMWKDKEQEKLCGDVEVETIKQDLKSVIPPIRSFVKLGVSFTEFTPDNDISQCLAVECLPKRTKS